MGKRTELHDLQPDSKSLKTPRFYLFLDQYKIFWTTCVTQRMYIVFCCGSMKPLWASEKVHDLVLETREFIEHAHKIQTSAMQLILLLRIYGGTLDVSKIPLPRGDGFSDILSYQPEANKPKKYYRLRYDNELYITNGWTVQMGVDGEVPPLTQEQLDLMLENPFDSDHLSSILDMSSFFCRGVAMCWAEEITKDYQKQKFQQELLEQDSLHTVGNLQRFQSRVASVYGIEGLEIGILLSPFDQMSRRARWEP